MHMLINASLFMIYGLCISITLLYIIHYYINYEKKEYLSGMIFFSLNRGSIMYNSSFLEWFNLFTSISSWDCYVISVYEL